MTTFRLFSILFFFVVFTSCGDDDDCCVLPAEDILINYDGDNFTAPNLPPGEYVFAMRMPVTTLNRLEGQFIKSVVAYIYNQPSSMNLNIYSEQNNLPGQIIHTQSVSSQNLQDWNTFQLTSPVMLDGSAVWVGFEVNLNSQMQTIGCDSGPASPNGDWLYDGSDQEFIRFANRVNDSVNWNIRVVIGE